MKKIITLILFVAGSYILFGINLSAQNFNVKIIDYKSNRIENIDLQQQTVMIDFKEETKAQFNFLELNNNEDDIHLVTVSDYMNNKWGMTPLLGMINSFEIKNPHIEVLAGINGDFYDIQDTGQPVGTHIEDYEVIKGSPTRNVFNIRANDTYDIQVPKKLGYELLIIDQDNEIKLRKNIDKFNQKITKSDEVGVIFHTFTEGIEDNYSSIFIQAEDIKYSNPILYTGFERAKGFYDENQDYNKLSKEQFLIFTGEENFNLEPEDKVLVQHKLEGFEDVRGTMGGGDILVENGEIGKTVDNPSGYQARAPRTSIGIKEDGSFFFMVSDGRNTNDNILGMTLEETGYLMKYLGAEKALNIDGGGSSTMIVKNSKGVFQTVNRLSDGNMRSVSNGILVVRGDINEQPINIDGEDIRIKFDKPSNVYIDSNNILHYDKVSNVTRYRISIDDKTYETSKNYFDLNFLKPGDYNITVNSKSNLKGLSSDKTESILHKHKHYTTEQILEWLKSFM